MTGFRECPDSAVLHIAFHDPSFFLKSLCRRSHKKRPRSTLVKVDAAGQKDSYVLLLECLILGPPNRKMRKMPREKWMARSCSRCWTSSKTREALRKTSSNRKGGRVGPCSKRCVFLGGTHTSRGYYPYYLRLEVAQTNAAIIVQGFF